MGSLVFFTAACGAPSQSATPGSAPVATIAASVSGSGGWTFDADAAGSLPAGAQTFSGAWAVRAETDAPSTPGALCQTGTTEFPAIMRDSKPYADVVVVARFKPISGSRDRAAGLLFRIKDGRNYYILRANALENNVNLYKYVDGRRSALKDGQAKVVSGEWQELRVEVNGQSLRGFLNGQPVVEANDTTFTAAGGIGLWTKADSQTCFDNVQVSVAAS
jgi:hypothetical protein